MTRPIAPRPLSPHLGIYRWQITNTLSILHRMTGVALSAGLVLLCAWLITAAWSPECFAQLRALLSTLVGKIALFGWTVAFYYHLANGMRHLNWDMGNGFKLNEVTHTGRFVIGFTLVMSVLTWAIALGKVSI